jgi:DNA replication protein DnaC
MTDHEEQTTISIATCTNCGTEFRAELYRWNGRVSPLFPVSHLCADCHEKRRQQEELEFERQRQDEILESTIPLIYRQTDREKMDLKLLEVVDAFDLKSGQGLFISGDFGKQKTRACTLLLERYCRAGSSIYMIQSTDLAKSVVEQFSDDNRRREDARSRLESCRCVDALLIDDLGKERATERFETELFSLIEFRTSMLRPTLYTSNLTLIDLLEKFSPVSGGGILRRITEFSQRLNV